MVWALRLLPVVSLLALLVSIMVVVMQGSELATIRSSVQQAPPWCRITGCLWPGAWCCWPWPCLLVRAADSRPQTGGLAARLAFVLILAGEMIGRGVFYGLHMTVGMAVAS
ncbi:anaerobic dimethyl sulfoxide reductase subunit C [Klebsiella pneumoniae subsp. ozaenae]|uniref:Anaerobic dimethyl sulfoxide reductase subunit C n=1 Tax=Klebsiella pneumoniae subsp. ozaenae TaxID=574 RepID=A0A377ZYV8_KLEPO|nr:anaerobic dimethyl sulfoxide reductase subunit C [Klebsiella pneumoniae subsp. ozaenae]